MSKKLAHLSDLHFGRDRPELIEPLIEAVNGLKPDLVAISGDLTQRARSRQFSAARAMIDRITAPCLIVPGNHDTPLDRPLQRLLDPWRGYRRWIDDDLEPQYHDDVISVVGLNTVNPFVWQRGRVGRRAGKRICAAFNAHPGRRARVIIAHHPLEHAPGERKGVTRGAGRAIRLFGECGADLVLSGHLHAWRAEPMMRGGAISVQAGTGLSTRQRGEENDFNLVTLEPDRIHIQRYAAEEGARAFAKQAAAQFKRVKEGWAATPAR